MKDIHLFPKATAEGIKFVLTDIDDTLTNEGRLVSEAYLAMEKLQQAGIKVVPITGRPAGWCDHIARMWPVDGVVGENGAFYFCYDQNKKKMIRRYWLDEEQRAKDQQKLEIIKNQVLSDVPGCAVSVDQAYREADLAIDFCEDVEPLNEKEISRIVKIFEEYQAIAKVSSIHVNGWFGDYDKLAMTKLFFSEVFQLKLSQVKDQVVFSGDSPNDAPMFGYFQHGVGVANVLEFKDSMESLPRWVTSKEGGYGFAEMATKILGGQ